MLVAAGTGFATAFALILAIGAQNAFVLRQGLRQSHVFIICLICALSDAVLITAGVAGFGTITATYPSLPILMTWAGAIFLFAYGALRFRAAWRGGDALDISGQAQPLLHAIMTCLAMTWLNPHVYLDTLGLIGAVSIGFAGPEKLIFGVGAVTASFAFFFTLGYGARLLAPVMQSEAAWRRLDIFIGLLMWLLAITLIASLD